MPEARTIKRAVKLTSATNVRDEIRLMILSGELTPGTKLRQQHLAKRFGVSINAIREALMELKGAGWVDTVDYCGVFVAAFDERKLLEVFEVREVLEGLAARLCCLRINRENLNELRDIAARICVANTAGDLNAALSLDREFHMRLAKIAGNETLSWISQTFRVMGPLLSSSGRGATETRDEHLAVLKAIEDNQPDEAERQMRRHIQLLREHYSRHVAAGHQLTARPVPRAKGT